jgi:hypothetical protein
LVVAAVIVLFDTSTPTIFLPQFRLSLGQVVLVVQLTVVLKPWALMVVIRHSVRGSPLTAEVAVSVVLGELVVMVQEVVDYSFRLLVIAAFL